MYVCMYICMYICMCVYAASECEGGMHLGLNVGGLNYWSSQVCMYVFVCVCMYLGLIMWDVEITGAARYVCIYVCLGFNMGGISCMCIYMHIHTHVCEYMCIKLYCINISNI
jgi:hypothetical protein